MTATTTAPTRDPTAIRKLVPQSVRSLLKCRLWMKATLVGGGDGLLCRIGSGSLKWLLLRPDGDKIAVKVWDAVKSRTLCTGAVAPDRLGHQLYLMATKMGAI